MVQPQAEWLSNQKKDNFFHHMSCFNLLASLLLMNGFAARLYFKNYRKRCFHYLPPVRLFAVFTLALPDKSFKPTPLL